MRRAIDIQNQPDGSPREADAARFHLDRARQALPKLGELPELQKATENAISAIGACLNYRANAPEVAQKAVSKAAAGVDLAIETAPNAKERERMRRELEGRAMGQALEQFGAQGVRFGERARDACAELDRAIEKASLDATSYLEQQSRSLSLQDALGEARLAEELQAVGLSSALARIERHFSVGDEAEGDRLLRLVKPHAVRMSRAPKSKFAQALGEGATDDAIQAERKAAWALVNLLDKRQRERTPAALRIARHIRDFDISPAFSITCGVHASRLSEAEFGAILANRRSLSPWELDDKWCAREVESPSWSLAREVPSVGRYKQ